MLETSLSASSFLLSEAALAEAAGPVREAVAALDEDAGSGVCVY